MISAWVGAAQNWPGDKFVTLGKWNFWERLNSNFKIVTSNLKIDKGKVWTDEQTNRQISKWISKWLRSSSK